MMKRLLLSSCRTATGATPRCLFHSKCRDFSTKAASRIPKDGLTLSDFVNNHATSSAKDTATTGVDPLLLPSLHSSNENRLFHLKTYGCQMNVNDSDIVRSLLLDAGLKETTDESEADVLLTNTCAIREGAEAKVWHRLRELRAHYKRKKIVGVLGCMAERLKHDLFQDGVADLVVGPDAYRDLPNLVSSLLQEEQELAVNVQLSLEETYADVTPVRRNPNDVSAFVSVMRGCNNMCSYCVVPFTRGRERSRPFDSIVEESRHLFEQEGVKEITLLGQNVNSYHDKSDAAVQARPASDYATSNDGFTNMFRLRGGAGYYFSDLVEAVSDISPELRVRFTSPHPKDYPPELLSLMAERTNVCSHLHMPAQSGSSTVLERMRRGYTREAYLQLIHDVRETIPDVGISSDFIAGFCGETDEEHQDTLSLMEQVQYDQAYMFAYSMRGKTHAHRKMQDDVSAEIKKQRLQEIISMFRSKVQELNEAMEVGRLRLVLVEGESKKSKPDRVTLRGRTDQNKRVVFDFQDCWIDKTVTPILSQIRNGCQSLHELAVGRPRRAPLEPGDYAVVLINEARGHTLRGQALWRTTAAKFDEMKLSQCDDVTLKQASILGDAIVQANISKPRSSHYC